MLQTGRLKHDWKQLLHNAQKNLNCRVTLLDDLHRDFGSISGDNYLHIHTLCKAIVSCK